MRKSTFYLNLHFVRKRGSAKYYAQNKQRSYFTITTKRHWNTKAFAYTNIDH